jgi:DNA repair exonuclease SbcCD ATPase subunit
MNITEINNTLEALENSLKGINSAKQQVEKTVKAYESVGIDIENYCASLQTISDNMLAILELIRDRQAELVNDGEKILDNLNKAVSDTLNQNKAMLDSVRSDFALKTQTAINDINTTVSDFGIKVKRLESLKDDIGKALSEAMSLRADINGYKTEVEQTLSGQNESLSLLKESIEKMSSKQEDTDTLIITESKTNKILTISNICLVAVVAVLLAIKLFI